jgi:hypothetical protein
LALLVPLLVAGVRAQDLEPRAFSPAPVGLDILSVGYSYSSGNVFFDQSLPIEDATGKLHLATIGYLRTLSLFGASAKLTAAIPFAWGDWDGLVMGEPASTSRRGFGDPGVGFAVNFVGGPALKPEDMRTYREGTVVGAGVMIVAPLGQYDEEKLINLGSNRWGFRTRIGMSHRMGRWILETIGESWLFTKIPEAYGGVSVSQDPIFSLQINAIYHTRRGFWVGGGYGYGEGGQTTVSGQEKNTRQINRRIGVTMVYPIDRRNSLKLLYIKSLSAVFGADYDRIGLSWRIRIG